MPGITLALTGHTPGTVPRWTRANVLCIDTGVHVAEYEYFTIAETQTGDARAQPFRRIERRDPQTLR